jgi:hypothetical protein
VNFKSMLFFPKLDPFLSKSLYLKQMFPKNGLGPTN